MLTFVTKIGTFVIAAATAILLARSLGPSARGLYALLILLPTTVVTAANVGFGTAVVVSVGRDERAAGRSLTHSLLVTLFASLVGWAAAALSYPLWRQAVPAAAPPLLVAALTAVPALLLYGFLISLVQGRRAFRTASALILFSYLIQFLLQAALVLWAGLGLDGAVWGFVIAHAVLVAVAFLVAVTRVRPGPADFGLLRQQLRFGLMTYIGSLAWLALSRTSLIVAGSLLSSAEVGRLAVALTLVEVLLYAADSVAFALAPHAAATGGDRFQHTRPALGAVVAASGAGAVVLFAVADAVVPIIFGPEYASAASAVRWLLPGMVAAGIARVASTDLIARRRERASMFALTSSAMVAVIASVVLTSGGGVDGAAAATSVGFIVAAGAVAVAGR